MEQKFSSLGVMEAANHSKNSAMEAENHVKHGASSKILTSRGNLLNRALLLAVCFISFSYDCFAQDIIVTKDARRISAKVMEVNVDNGGALTSIGIFVCFTGIGAASQTNNPEWLYLLYPGITLFNVGIPFWAVGGGMKKNAISNFRKQFYSSQSAVPHFQFNMYPNRIGLAYVF